jgi:hypothetical protein
MNTSLTEPVCWGICFWLTCLLEVPFIQDYFGIGGVCLQLVYLALEHSNKLGFILITYLQ